MERNYSFLHPPKQVLKSLSLSGRKSENILFTESSEISSAVHKGCVRCSTIDHRSKEQIQPLHSVGCEKISSDAGVGGDRVWSSNSFSFPARVITPRAADRVSVIACSRTFCRRSWSSAAGYSRPPQVVLSIRRLLTHAAFWWSWRYASCFGKEEGPHTLGTSLCAHNSAYYLRKTVWPILCPPKQVVGSGSNAAKRASLGGSAG